MVIPHLICEWLSKFSKITIKYNKYTLIANVRAIKK